MHEIKLAENIVSILEEEVQAPDVGDIKTVHLEVGKLRYIVPEVMTSCFAHISKSKKLKNAGIDIKVIPVKMRCRECGAERVVDDGIYSCRGCGDGKPEIISGNEFRIKGIEW